MKQIRILHIVHSMNAGGIETFIMNLYRNINRESVQFDFLVNTNEVCFFDKEIESMGGRIYRIDTPYYPIINRKYNLKLLTFFEEHQEYRIIHCHRNTTSLYALKQAQHVGIPVRIAHAHNADNRFTIRTPFYSWNKLFIKEYATHWFACSEMAGQWMYGRRALRDEKFKKIPNAIDVQKFSYNEHTRSKMRKQLEIENNLVVGHIGRFTKQKNHLFLIRIFVDLLKQRQDARLLLLGEGPLLGKVKKACVSLGIIDKVIFAGVQRNAADYYQAMDVFLFPSLYEGLGIAAIEAQAAGLPILASDKVPREMQLTENVEFLSLNESMEQWVERILSMAKLKRDITAFVRVERAGYSIIDEARSLEEFYTSV